MSELKVIDLGNIRESIEKDEPVYYEYYAKSEADKVIAELKSENERLKATPEEIAKELYTKMLVYPHNMVRLEDAYRIAVSRRKTKRALWLARANMARGLAEMCEHQFDCCGVSRSRFLVGYDKKLKPKRMTTTEWGELWRKVEQKCRAKAEEYK